MVDKREELDRILQGLSPEEVDKLLRERLAQNASSQAGSEPSDPEGWASPLANLRDHAPIYVSAAADELLHALGPPMQAPRMALWCLCETVEAITRFLAIMGLAELASRNDGVLPAPIREALASVIEQPTFGVWRLAFDKAVDVLGTTSNLMPEITAARAALRLLFTPSGTERTEETDIITVRNSLAHGLGVSRDRARQLLALWGPRVSKAAAGLSWLGDVALWVCDANGTQLLREPRRSGGLDHTQQPPTGLQAGDVVAARGDTVVWLNPFGRRSPVGNTEPVTQIFMRRDPQALVYALFGSDAALQVRSDAASLARFIALFDLDSLQRRLREKLLSEPGFEQDVDRDAGRFVGREDDLANLLIAIHGKASGAIWLQGEAGVGKSALLAKAASHLSTECDGKFIVHTYRFRFRDSRCAALPFHRWLIERIDPDEAKAFLKGPRTLTELRQFATRLLATRDGKRLVFMLDGLDEIERCQCGFCVDTLPDLISAGNALFVLSGRPEAGLPMLMDAFGAAKPFDGNLRPMRKSELRAMIDFRLPQVARRLIKSDGNNEEIRNAFVDRLAERSQGLPIYVELVLRDIAQGAYSRFDQVDAEQLAPGVREYFQRLLVQSGIGDLSVYRPHVLCLLALAFEPLTSETLAALLRGEYDAGEQQTALVNDAINDLGGLVRQTVNQDGALAWQIFHKELEEYIRTWEGIAAIRRKLSDVLIAAGKTPTDGPAERYLMRCAVQHLLGAGRGEEAAELISDIDYQIARLRTLAAGGGDGGLRADWVRIVETGLTFTDEAAAWWNFWATDGARFLPEEGAVQPRDFVECTLTYATDTTVGRAIAKVDLRLFRPMITFDVALRRPGQEAVAFWGHTGSIVGATELPGERLLSWAEDHTLRLWRLNGQRLAKVMTVRNRKISGAIGLESGRIVSWTRSWFDRGSSGMLSSVINVWTGDGEPIAGPIEVEGEVKSAHKLEAGRFATLASHAAQPAMRLWDADGTPINDLVVPPAKHGQFLPGDRVLLWSDRKLRIHALDGRPIGLEMTREAEFEGAYGFADGRILTWWNDGYMQLFDTEGRPLAATKHGHEHPEKSAAVLVDGRLLTWEYFGAVKLWSSDLVPLEFKSPFQPLLELRVLRDGSVLVVTGVGSISIHDQSFMAIDRFRGTDALELFDGRILYWADSVLYMWDRNRQSGVETRREWNRYDTETVKRHFRKLDDRLRGYRKYLDQLRSEGGGSIRANIGAVLRDAGSKIGRTIRGRIPSRQAVDDLFRDNDGTLIQNLEIVGRRAARHVKSFLQSLASRTFVGGDNLSMTQLYAGSEKWQQQASLALPNGRFVTWHDGLQLWSYYGEKIGDEVEVGTIGAILIGYDQLLTWNALGAFQLRAVDLKKIDDPILAHTSWPTGVIVLRDNRLLSMSNDQTLRLWTPAGKLAGAPMRGHQADVIGATELDDGRLLSWSRDRTMRLWSAEGLSLRRHLFWYGVPTELPGTLLFRTDVLERRVNSPSPYRHVQCQVD